jgi:hypothetical protein
LHPCKPIAVFVALLATNVLHAQVHYVDGQTGNDVATAGSSALTPWRTIGYAMTQVTAPASGSMELRIAGNQAYGSATNGEVFPLALPPRITLRADPASAGASPIFMPSAGQTTIELAATSTYPGDYLLCEGIWFNGGIYGIHCGAAPLQSHALSITQCRFSDQSGAGIYVGSDGSALELAVFNCEFLGVGRVANGIEAHMLAVNCDHHIEVAGCRFRGLDNGLLTASTWFILGDGLMQSTVARSDFEDCNYGMQFRHPPQTGSIGTYAVTRTRVASCDVGIGILDSQTFGAYGDKTLDVEHCWIHSCATGIQVGAPLGQNGFDAETTVAHIKDSAIADCNTGTTIYASFRGYDSFFATDTIWSNNVTGIGARAGGDTAGIQVDLQRCRVLNSTNGLEMVLHSTPDSRVRLEACVIAGCNGDAISYSAFGGQPGYPAQTYGYFHHLTLADNGRAMAFASLPISYSATNNAFTNNAADLDLAATVSTSMTDGTNLAGTNNTVTANMQLLRPSFKPAPNSPCIDAGAASGVGYDYEGDSYPAPGTAPDIGADEFYSTGSSRTYGTASTGATNHQPAIGPTGGSAAIGSAIPIELAINPPPSSVAFAVLGVGYSELAPFEPIQIAPGSMIWVEASTLSQPMAIPASGMLGINQYVPPIAGLVGLSFHAQWLVLLSGGELVTSDGLRITLGS